MTAMLLLGHSGRTPFTSPNPHDPKPWFWAVGSTLPRKASAMRRTLAYFPSQEWLRAWLTDYTGSLMLHGQKPFAQFIRICRWLQLIHKDRLALLKDTPVSMLGARKRYRVAQRFRQYLRATNCYKLSDSSIGEVPHNEPQGSGTRPNTGGSLSTRPQPPIQGRLG